MKIPKNKWWLKPGHEESRCRAENTSRTSRDKDPRCRNRIIDKASSLCLVHLRKTIAKQKPAPPAKDIAGVARTTLAMAQALVSSAMIESGVWPAEMSRRLDVDPGRVAHLLNGEGMTMRSFARALAACGFEPRFSYVPAGNKQPKG